MDMFDNILSSSINLMRILIVEDEIELCNTIAEGLFLDGYAVDTCYDGEKAYEQVFVENYDLIVLDLNLPNVDGIEILERIRKENNQIKILILSARGSVADKVRGLDLGSNDYLSKPFDFEELEARIRNLLRRKFLQEDSILKFNELFFDTKKRIVCIEQKEIELTKKEKTILEYMLLNNERVISQEELIEHAWDINSSNISNSVRVHIASLRKKLKNEMKYDVIKTKIGEGYYLNVKENDY